MQKTKKAVLTITILLTLIMASAMLLPALAAGNVEVNFRLIGADADGVYTTWIATKTFTVPAGSMVSDLFDIALADAKLTPTFVSADWGSYLSAIAAPAVLGGFTLSEDSFGEWPDATYAGWMFSVNGLLSSVGMTETPLSSGDNVVFFYAYDMNDGVDWTTNDASRAPAMSAPDVAPSAPSVPGATDEPAPAPAPAPVSPATGDGGIVLWICLGGAGLLGFVAVAAIDRRGKRAV